MNFQFDEAYWSKEAAEHIHDFQKQSHQRRRLAAGLDLGPCPAAAWPIFVRLGGINKHGEPGLKEGEFNEILEWEPGFTAKPSEPIRIIIGAPSATPPGIFDNHGTSSFPDLLVPRLRLGTRCPRGSASRMSRIRESRSGLPSRIWNVQDPGPWAESLHAVGPARQAGPTRGLPGIQSLLVRFMGIVIEINDVYKIYDTGAVKVEALRGRLAEYLGRRVRRHSRLQRLRQIDAHEHPRLPRPPHARSFYKLDGQDVSRLSRKQLAQFRNRKLGFIFQGFNLLQRYRRQDNVALPLLYSGIPAGQRRQRALAVLDMMGLRNRAVSSAQSALGGPHRAGHRPGFGERAADSARR